MPRSKFPVREHLSPYTGMSPRFYRNVSRTAQQLPRAEAVHPGNQTGNSALINANNMGDRHAAASGFSA